jgi:formylglycine-generating enzyme required for sulfatase activity
MSKGTNSKSGTPLRKICANCKTQFDSSRTSEGKCWLCNGKRFVDAPELEPPEPEEQAGVERFSENTLDDLAHATEKSGETVHSGTSVIGEQRVVSTYQLRRRIRFKYRLVIAFILIVVSISLTIGLVKRSEPTKADDKDGSSSPAPTPVASASQQPEPPAGMVLVPGGTFIMGRDRTNGGDEYESPAHEVTIKAFFIDRYEVTREQYKRCVDAGNCQAPFGWSDNSYPANTGRWPVTGVTWEDAVNYAAAVGKRLPTEEEWEFAAGRGQKTRYPWGDTWLLKANVNTQTLSEVGQYEQHYGLFDIIGNAQEWTTSEWKQYPDKTDFIKTNERVERLRVIRGGSYRSLPAEATITYRNALRIREDAAEEDHYERTGFRCVQSAERP